MKQELSTPEGKDPQLWELAQRRAAFKRHLSTYIVVNIFLWCIWYFTDNDRSFSGMPWPAWASLGWGIGIGMQYINAYVSTGHNSVHKEYDKLTNNQNK